MRRSSTRHIVPVLFLGTLAALVPFALQRVYGHEHVMFTSHVHFEGVGLTALTADRRGRLS